MNLPVRNGSYFGRLSRFRILAVRRKILRASQRHHAACPQRARWNVFLARFVPHQTVHRCFGRCQDDGILKKIFGICTASSTGAELSMDSTSIKASVQAGSRMRKRGKARQQNEKASKSQTASSIGKIRGVPNTEPHAIAGR